MKHLEMNLTNTCKNYTLQTTTKINAKSNGTNCAVPKQPSVYDKVEVSGGGKRRIEVCIHLILEVLTLDGWRYILIIISVCTCQINHEVEPGFHNGICVIQAG